MLTRINTSCNPNILYFRDPGIAYLPIFRLQGTHYSVPCLPGVMILIYKDGIIRRVSMYTWRFLSLFSFKLQGLLEGLWIVSQWVYSLKVRPFTISIGDSKLGDECINRSHALARQGDTDGYIDCLHPSNKDTMCGGGATKVRFLSRQQLATRWSTAFILVVRRAVVARIALLAWTDTPGCLSISGRAKGVTGDMPITVGY